MEVGLGPGHIVLDGDRTIPSTKRGRSPSPISGPFLLWQNGWMHQVATWYGGRPQLRRLCVRWGRNPLPTRGRSPYNFWPRVYCCQTAVWIKMVLGTEVGLGQDDIVLDGNPANPLQKEAEPLIFGPCLLWPNRCMDQDATWCGGSYRPRRHCARCGPSSPPQKVGRPPIFGPFLLWPNGWMHQDVAWYGGSLSPGDFALDEDPDHLPKKGRTPQFSADVYCGQTAGCIKMPLSTEVGLSQGDCVRWGPSSPPQKRGTPMSIVVKRLYVSGYHLVQG